MVACSPASLASRQTGQTRTTAIPSGPSQKQLLVAQYELGKYDSRPGMSAQGSIGLDAHSGCR
jgi:hypothetical protein